MSEEVDNTISEKDKLNWFFLFLEKAEWFFVGQQRQFVFIDEQSEKAIERVSRQESIINFLTHFNSQRSFAPKNLTLKVLGFVKFSFV